MYQPLARFVLAWTQNGRPDAYASFWVHRLPDRLRELHEFQSLSLVYGARLPELLVYKPELEMWKGEMDVHLTVDEAEDGRDSCLWWDESRQVSPCMPSKNGTVL